MQPLFSKIEIRHFKSIIDISLQPKRINLIIGKPNSGKSNILEALTLFSPHYTLHQGSGQIRFFDNIIRYKEMNQLFYDMDINKPVEIISDKCQARLRYLRGIDYYDFLVTENKKELKIAEYTGTQSIGTIQNKLNEFAQTKPQPKFINTYYNYIHLNGQESQNKSVNGPAPVKKYFFHEKEFFTSSFAEFLLPSGDNLYQIIQSSLELREIIDSILEESNLELVFINKSKTFEIQKRVNRIAYQTPYLLTSLDTLQRLIYHLAAVISNKDSVLLFEEPEAHSFPPYIDTLTRQIIDSTKNQFFITTHSPYIVNQFLDQAKRTDLAIFIAHYENFSTKIKRLTTEEMKQIHGYGIDIFYNLDSFVKND